MGRLDGRVAIVTGAGRGLGRAYALALAEAGAAVVVNDLGATLAGERSGESPAAQVAQEIVARGGRAAVSGHDVADWAEAAALVALAVERFGDLHIVVNNAGILRDRTLANMSEAEWDAVVRVHLKGHAATTRHAMAYWRERHKAGAAEDRALIHTSSIAGLRASFGQASYSAAKLGIVGLSSVAALEGERYGVRSNVVAPSARTRLSDGDGALEPPPAPGGYDRLDPAHVAPLVVWLAGAACPATGQIFHLYGGNLRVLAPPPVVHRLTVERRWTPEALDAALAGRLVPPADEDWLAEDAE